MIAKYKEHYYSYSANSGERTIVTENKEKAYPEFEYEEDDEVFYKDVSEEELSDIFDIRFFVEYDTQLPHTPLMWELFPEDFSENGWYRYDTRFGLPVYGDDGEISRYNIFNARLLIRHAGSGKKYLYDVMEIKKETSKSCQADALPGDKPIS